MENLDVFKKQRPVFRMLKRMVEHAKTKEEIEYLWELVLGLLDTKERHSWLIRVFVEYQFSLPKEVKH